MFKLMIADDNPYFRKDLSEFIDWEIFDFELVGTFENGRDLLDAASADMPDLVMTDVMMPIMDGFELSSELYRLNPDVTIIFISGYSEFHYAQKALKLGIFDYILKPLNKSNFLQCMEKAHQKLVKDQLARLETVNKNSQQDYYRKIALSHYVGSLLFYAADDELIQEGLTQLGYLCSADSLHYVACFSIEQFSNTEPDSSTGMPNINFLKFVLESSTTDIQIVPALLEKNSGVFLLSCSDPALSVYDLFSTLCVDMEVNLNLRINIGYAGPCMHFTELPKLYTQAQKVHSNLFATASIVPIASAQDLPMESSTEIISHLAANNPYSPNVAKMRDYIEQQYMNRISTQDVARYVFLSSGYANICFTNECGTSIFNYIVQMRINKAIQLLKETAIPVTAIAEKVGYSSKTSFYLAFKRYTGISPTECRSLDEDIT